MTIWKLQLYFIQWWPKIYIFFIGSKYKNVKNFYGLEWFVTVQKLDLTKMNAILRIVFHIILFANNILILKLKLKYF